MVSGVSGMKSVKKNRTAMINALDIFHFSIAMEPVAYIIAVNR